MSRRRSGLRAIREGRLDARRTPRPERYASLRPRAWCNGCTRAFQALSTGSIPVARFQSKNVIARRCLPGGPASRSAIRADQVGVGIDSEPGTLRDLDSAPFRFERPTLRTADQLSP